MRLGTAFVILAVGSSLAASCTGAGGGSDGAEHPSASAKGFVSDQWVRGREDAYLAAVTKRFEPTSVLSVLAHAERRARGHDGSVDVSDVGPESFEATFRKIDGVRDTSDFDLLFLMNLWYGYRADLAPAMRRAIERRVIGFKYWYTEPNRPGTVDNKWYWSENHRIIFHTLEYLAGQAFPRSRFTNDGRTGADHRRDGGRRVESWIAEKARLGFTEWHSDVYYQEDITALLSLVEFADDRVLARRAAMVLDLFLFDLALHLQRGNNGATHGRSYMKDKSRALDQDVFPLAKLLFDDTSQAYPAAVESGALLMARARKYRLPEVVRRVAVSRKTTVDRERMGVALDPSAPITEHPTAPLGYNFDDPANVEFWFDRGAFAAWQVVGATLATADRYRLWSTELWKPFRALRDATGGDPKVARPLVRSLAPMVNFSLLTEANTYTYRSPDVMLSTVQDYRPGAFGAQYHAWQATLDEQAVVFTTHPKNEPRPGARWPDSDGYWTGTGSMPRSAQQGTAAVHLYTPVFSSPDGPPLDTFAYRPYTHAYFPQERFDEVTSVGHWTFGRKGRGYVALWSWRPVRWRPHDPVKVFTNGLRQPFDLVAEGGASNVWVTEVGDEHRWGSFARFREAVAAAPVDVTDLGQDQGLSRGFRVAYRSPAQGEMRFGSTGPLTVRGKAVALDQYPRYDNPWSRAAFGATVVSVRDGRHRLTLDFGASRRTAE